MWHDGRSGAATVRNNANATSRRRLSRLDKEVCGYSEIQAVFLGEEEAKRDRHVNLQLSRRRSARDKELVQDFQEVEPVLPQEITRYDPADTLSADSKERFEGLQSESRIAADKEELESLSKANPKSGDATPAQETGDTPFAATSVWNSEKSAETPKPKSESHEKSAEEAWMKGDAVSNCVRVEIRPGVGRLSYLSGTYVLQHQSLRRAPTYKRLSATLEPEWWLYYATDGRWHVGRRYQKDRKWPTRRLRSGVCKPGTLPKSAVSWQRWLPVAWISTNVGLKGTTRKEYEDGWKKADAGENCFQIEISGDSVSSCFHESANGLYDLLPKITPLHPPVYMKRMDYNGCWEPLANYCWDTQLYLYFASDSRWHIGNIHEQSDARVGRRLRSAAVSAGTFPKDAQGWEHMRPLSRCIAFLTFHCCAFVRWPSLRIRFLCDCPCGFPCICDCPFGCLGWRPSQAKIAAFKRDQIDDSWKKADTTDAAHRLFIRPLLPFGISWRPSLAACLWCGHYDLLPQRRNREFIFAKRGFMPHMEGCSYSSKLFLYRSSDGRWRVGGHQAKAGRQHRRGLLRSQPCKEGVLPGSVDGSWQQKCCCIWLPVSIKVVAQTKTQIPSGCFSFMRHKIFTSLFKRADERIEEAANIPHPSNHEPAQEEAKARPPLEPARITSPVHSRNLPPSPAKTEVAAQIVGSSNPTSMSDAETNRSQLLAVARSLATRMEQVDHGRLPMPMPSTKADCDLGAGVNL